MDKKHKKTHRYTIPPHEGDVEFCLNCSDMDDLAVSEEARDLGQLRSRFDGCRETGKFQGDVCARIYVAEDRIDNPAFFADEEEDS